MEEPLHFFEKASSCYLRGLELIVVGDFGEPKIGRDFLRVIAHNSEKLEQKQDLKTHQYVPLAELAIIAILDAIRHPSLEHWKQSTDIATCHCHRQHLHSRFSFSDIPGLHHRKPGSKTYSMPLAHVVFHVEVSAND